MNIIMLINVIMLNIIMLINVIMWNIIMLINVKMPTFVGILTYIIMMNTSTMSLKARKVFIFSIIVFMNIWYFMLSLAEYGQVFIILGATLACTLTSTYLTIATAKILVECDIKIALAFYCGLVLLFGDFDS